MCLRDSPRQLPQECAINSTATPRPSGNARKVFDQRRREQAVQWRRWASQELQPASWLQLMSTGVSRNMALSRA